jgi:hypothetical protein
MFTALIEEVLPTLPATQLQLDRINRALAECDGYEYTDRSDFYQEPATSVKTLSGNTYLVFPNQCGCRDWEERCWGQIDEHGRETACKHILSAFFTGNLMYPEDPSPAQGEEVADPTLPDVPDFNEWPEEWDGEPVDGNYPQAYAEAHAPDLSDADILRIR